MAYFFETKIFKKKKMDKKKILLGIFIIVALVQLYVPAKMIFDKEGVIKTGTEYKFKTAPVDPHDPFRGKFITLNYEETTFEVQDITEWTNDQIIYVLFEIDNEGFAQIQSVSNEIPTQRNDYLKTKIDYVKVATNELVIVLPFDRFYMEESKAYDAEIAYRESQSDISVTYALVNIKSGDAVLKDVLIDDVSVKDIE